MELTAANVSSVFRDCLWDEDEIGSISREELLEKSKLVEGIMTKAAFNPKRLSARSDDIASMLGQLPAEFLEGWSFLNACMRKDDTQWGEHTNMDELFILGQAIDRVQLCAPREMWSAMPGGMPYYQVVEEAQHGS